MEALIFPTGRPNHRLSPFCLLISSTE